MLKGEPRKSSTRGRQFRQMVSRIPNVAALTEIVRAIAPEQRRAFMAHARPFLKFPTQ